MIYLDPDKNGGYVKGATLPTNLIKDFDGAATMKTIPAVRSYCQRTTSSMKYVMGDYEYQRGAVIWGLATNPDVRQVADFFDAGIQPYLHFPIVEKITKSRSLVGSQDGTTIETRDRQSGDQEGTKSTIDKNTSVKTTTKTTFKPNNKTEIETTTTGLAGVAIDYSTDSVPDNPFKFEKTYSWLKVGDTISQDKNGYERVETWWGSEEEWE